MQMEHGHGHSDDEARARIDALTEHWSTRYAMSGSWRGEAFRITGKTKGIRLGATFTAAPGRVIVRVDVPFFARKIGRTTWTASCGTTWILRRLSSSWGRACPEPEPWCTTP